MASLNSFCFTGHLGRDPELRETPAGVPVCELNVAVAAYKRDDPPLWVRVHVWREQGERCAEYLKKGREVAVQGDVSQVRAYARSDGEPGASLEVTARSVSFIGSREGGDEGEPAQAPHKAPF